MMSLGLGKLGPVDTLDNISEAAYVWSKTESEEQRLPNVYRILHWERYDA
jgi:hypothetical protein